MMHQTAAIIEKTLFYMGFEGMKMHQYNPTAINVFFFLFSTSSSSCSSPQDSPIRPRGSLQAFMPATNGATARLTNTKISQTGEGEEKREKKKALVTMASIT